MKDSDWAKLPVININDERAKCRCGAGLSGLDDFVYEKQAKNTDRTRDELCTCLSCGARFVLHYDLFDPDGHVYGRVFTGDINNPNYSWQDILTEEQKNAIKDHLSGCTECTDRLSEEMLADAWFSDFMNQLRAARAKT